MNTSLKKIATGAETGQMMLYPLPEVIRFEEARLLGENREWKELSDGERINFEVAEILHMTTWVNNFPLYIIRNHRPGPSDPEKCANEERWISLQAYYKDIDCCIEKLGFDLEEVNSYTFQVGGDPVYDELMRRFGASIYREMRMLGYDERRLRS